MSTTLEPSPAEAPAHPEGSPYLFTTEDFDRMIEADVFPDEARVELWDGRIHEKMAKTNAHAVAGINATMTLFRNLPPGWCLSHENPIVVRSDRAPLPDLVALRGTGNDYVDRRPQAADIGLIVELSLSSLKFDTGAKLAGYAEAGVPTYWVVNLVDWVIFAHTSPLPAERRYASVATFKPGDLIPLTLGGAAIAPIAASEILPAR